MKRWSNFTFPEYRNVLRWGLAIWQLNFYQQESCQTLGFLRTDLNLGRLEWLSVLEDLFAWEMMLNFGQQNRSSFYSTTSLESGLVKNMQVLEESHFETSFVIIAKMTLFVSILGYCFS